MKKTAIVTGCNGGIGYATAEKLMNEGYFVVGMDVADEGKIASPDFKYVKGDLSKSADRENLVKEATAVNGRIDVLVNVAGVAPKVRADILEMTEESYDFVMGINTKGTLFLTQLVANQMIKNEIEDGIRGYIYNIASESIFNFVIYHLVVYQPR